MELSVFLVIEEHRGSPPPSSPAVMVTFCQHDLTWAPMDRDHLAEAMFIRLLLCKVTLPVSVPSSRPISIVQKEVTAWSLHLRRGSYVHLLCSLRLCCLHNLFGVLHGRFSSSLLCLNLSNYLWIKYIYSRLFRTLVLHGCIFYMHGYFLSWDINRYCFIFLPLGTPSVSSHGPLTHIRSFSFSSTSLHFGTIRGSKSLCTFSSPCLESDISLRSPDSFILEKGFRNQDLSASWSQC